MEECIAEVARKLLSIMQKKYDLPKIARIVGPKAVKEKILKILPQRPSAQPTIPGQPQGGQQGQPGGQPQQQPNPVAQQSHESDFGFSWNRQDILGDMDVDVLAGSTVPMDRESQLQILEKMIPILQLMGIAPGDPAAKEFAREMGRLAGLMSFESVVDLADQTPMKPPPKMMEIQAKTQAKAQETQAKVQAKTAETKMNLQAMQQEEQLKLQAMREKLNMDREKHHMGIQKEVISGVLEKFRNGANNGQSQVPE
jgi:hypothetical protein